MNRQKSRENVENVLSGAKAGFQSILNFEHAIERNKMENQKSKSTFSATLLTLTLMVAVFLAGPAAAQKKYVTDPATGKEVTAPEYGGILTYSQPYNPPSPDVYIHHDAAEALGVVVETLAIADWALDRDVFNYRTTYMPDFVWRGHLAESWETPDPLTIVLHIREGVRWHNKAPMNSRELTAKDIEYNLHRYLGLGSGYTEPNPKYATHPMIILPWESVTATDDRTVVFRLTKADPNALKQILYSFMTFIYPPEVIKEHGDLSDWRNVVGTGPFELTDWVEGSSLTWKKNPDYWGYDEKYPENRLPYLDGLEMLVMPDVATRMAALRSGKIDGLAAFLGWSQLKSMDQVDSLRKTNPELVMEPFSFRSMSSWTVNTRRPPFDDVRVRHAMQMALDLDTINAAYWKGYADTTPQGRVGAGTAGYFTPFADWPEEVKGYYTYDPAGAEALLDEAGYPRGSDGIRFKTVLEVSLPIFKTYVQNSELAASYWAAIGVHVEVRETETSVLRARVDEGDYDMITTSSGSDTGAMGLIMQNTSDSTYNTANVRDPVYDAMVADAQAATTIEERKRLIKPIDMYMTEKHWYIWGSRVPTMNVLQPWVIGYNGEYELGSVDRQLIAARLWIDSELKEAMGH